MAIRQDYFARGLCFMKIVIIRAPKYLSPIIRKIFGIKKVI